MIIVWCWTWYTTYDQKHEESKHNCFVHIHSMGNTKADQFEWPQFYKLVTAVIFSTAKKNNTQCQNLAQYTEQSFSPVFHEELKNVTPFYEVLEKGTC